ncbi:MAG: carbon-nitrogen hydrolase family protein [Acidobacteria bacterium]|nr:carbon-nitrogen hydrolase family protein [Acidobacteriota bacterium]
MLLAVMQAEAKSLDVESNLRTIASAAKSAAEAGAGMLLTPELFPVGYDPLRIAAEFNPCSLPALRQQLAAIASAHGVALVYSVPAPDGHGGLYISATLVDAQGTEVLQYQKVHLFGPDERHAFHPSDQPPAVVELNGVRVSLLICFDVEFPESVRAAALRGAELVLVPTALAHGFSEVPDLLIRARALENHVVVAYANHSGVEAGITFGGGSIIAGADGGVISSAGADAQLIFGHVDPEVIRAGREEVPYVTESRQTLYAQWEQQRS